MRHNPHWPRVGKAPLGEVESDEDLEDFDETISADLESTRRNMRALTDRQVPAREVEYRLGVNASIQSLTEDLTECRAALAKAIHALNRKASKGSVSDLEERIERQRKERWETTRNWLVFAVSIAGVILGVAKLVRG